MLRRFIHLQATAGFLSCLLFAVEPPARGADPSDPLVDECVKGVISRHGQFNPQWVRFKATEFMASSVSKSEGDSNYRVDAEYAVKGNKRRSWCKILSGGDKVFVRGSVVWFINNGEVQTSQGRDEKTFAITRKREPLNAKVAPPLDVAGENHVYDSLQAWAAKDGTSGIKASRIMNPQGESSVILEWVYPKKNGWSKCSLSPSRGYAVEWYEQHYANGKLARRSTTSEWIVMDGVNFPKHTWIGSAYNAAGKPEWTTEIEVTSLELQARKIPDRLFQVDFPDDAVIYDMDKQTPIRKTELAQTHLDEVVKRIERPRTNWWTLGLWTAVGIGGLLFGAFLYRRRRASVE